MNRFLFTKIQICKSASEQEFLSSPSELKTKSSIAYVGGTGVNRTEHGWSENFQLHPSDSSKSDFRPDIIVETYRNKGDLTQERDPRKNRNPSHYDRMIRSFSPAIKRRDGSSRKDSSSYNSGKETSSSGPNSEVHTGSENQITTAEKSSPSDPHTSPASTTDNNSESIAMQNNLQDPQDNGKDSRNSKGFTTTAPFKNTQASSRKDDSVDQISSLSPNDNVRESVKSNETESPLSLNENDAEVTIDLENFVNITSGGKVDGDLLNNNSETRDTENGQPSLSPSPGLSSSLSSSLSSGSALLSSSAKSDASSSSSSRSAFSWFSPSMIVIVVVGGCLTIALVVVSVYICARRRRSKPGHYITELWYDADFKPQSVTTTDFQKGNLTGKDGQIKHKIIGKQSYMHSVV